MNSVQYGEMAVVMTQPIVQNSNTINDFNDVIQWLGAAGNIITYLLVAFAVIVIVYNVVMSMVYGTDPKAKSDALKNVGWGILGLAIIVSLWGIVNIITSTFRTNTRNLPPIPNANFVSPSQK